MKEKLGQAKEYAGKLGKKTKIAAAAVLVGVILFAVAAALVLNNKSYGVLFTGLNTEEAQQIIGKLNESGVDFQYKDDGTILVDETQVDQLKAELVYEGYPKSGFTYDVFTSNAGLMSTDSDKQTYLLYQLQDRIGATIRLFEGVKDAKVTIALGEKERYALSDEQTESSSASAVVIMKDGGSPTERQAAAVQRLVAKSVPGMEIDNVAVFDGSGNEISVSEEAENAAGGRKSEEIAQIVEQQIAERILNVLEPVYGQNSVKVSARAKINMEKLIRESTTYSTPEKIDDEDKTGIVSSESSLKESSGGGTVAGGAAGSDPNADVPEYNTEEEEADNGYSSESVTKEYLVNQIKEQGQIDPGMLEDLTVSVVIDGKNFGDLSEDELRELIGNAAGIAEADRAGKISIASAPFFKNEVPEETEEPQKQQEEFEFDWRLAAAAGGAGLLILLISIVMLIITKRRRKKKKQKALQEAAASSVPEQKMSVQQEQPKDEDQPVDHSMELRKNIRDFTEKNPEISAQMLRNWLNSGRGGE